MKFDKDIYTASGTLEDTSVYSAWLACADERSLFQDQMRIHTRRWLRSNPTRLLDVGCGSGAAGLLVMDIAKELGILLQYTGVDPYPDQLRVFREALSGKMVDLRVATLESFKTTEVWDVAMAIHSLYYVPNMKEALQRLATFGKMLVLVHHGSRGINEVHQAFRHYVHEGPHIISTYDDIEAELDGLGWEHDLIRFPSKVDVSKCKDSQDSIGKNLMRFFIEDTQPRDDVLGEMSEWFRSRPDIMIHDVGLFFIYPT